MVIFTGCFSQSDHINGSFYQSDHNTGCFSQSDHNTGSFLKKFSSRKINVESTWTLPDVFLKVITLPDLFLKAITIPDVFRKVITIPDVFGKAARRCTIWLLYRNLLPNTNKSCTFDRKYIKKTRVDRPTSQVFARGSVLYVRTCTTTYQYRYTVIVYS